MRDGFWDLLDLIREKAMTVRAIADVLGVVDAHELEPDTLRSLGVLFLAETGSMLAALDRLGSWGKRKGLR
jgi:hypothetical protein